MKTTTVYLAASTIMAGLLFSGCTTDGVQDSEQPSDSTAASSDSSRAWASDDIFQKQVDALPLEPEHVIIDQVYSALPVEVPLTVGEKDYNAIGIVLTCDGDGQWSITLDDESESTGSCSSSKQSPSGGTAFKLADTASKTASVSAGPDTKLGCTSYSLNLP